MSITPRFSVVIPTRGDAPHLRRALASCLEQGEALEALVAHAASAPLPRELLADERVVAVPTEAHTPGGRRNAALARARAPYVAFLDDDDLWLPGHLAAAGSSLDRDRALAACACDAWVFTDESRDGSAEPPQDLARLPRFLGPGPALTPSASELLVRNVVLTPAVVVRSAALREAGGFDEALAAMEDWDLWLRIARSGPVRVAREARIVVRKRAGSASRDLHAMAACGLAVARRAIAAGVALDERDRRELLGRLTHDLAYACLRAGDAAGAREASRSAIALDPGRIDNYLYWLAGLAPPALRRFVFGVELRS